MNYSMWFGLFTNGRYFKQSTKHFRRLVRIDCCTVYSFRVYFNLIEPTGILCTPSESIKMEIV